MMYKLSILLLLLLTALMVLVGCRKDGAPARAAMESAGANEPADAKRVAIQLVDAEGSLDVSSPAFTNGAPMPATYSAYGEDVSPPLKIGKVPAGTQSLVVLMEDPDAKEPKPFIH